MKLSELDAKIFDAVKNSSYKNRITAKAIFTVTGIDNRMVAACVRKMNELNKGIFYIGSDKKGYWLCRNEEEAITSLLSYNSTILSMLGERKKVKEQIRETFGSQKDLFGQKELSQNIG